jgi:hypothetical protein
MRLANGRDDADAVGATLSRVKKIFVLVLGDDADGAENTARAKNDGAARVRSYFSVPRRPIKSARKLPNLRHCHCCRL